MSRCQNGSAWVRLNAKDVEIVSATIGGQEKHARWIEAHRGDGLGVGEEVSDDRVASVNGDWRSRGRADVLDRMFDIQDGDDARLASVGVDVARRSRSASTLTRQIRAATSQSSSDMLAKLTQTFPQALRCI